MTPERWQKINQLFHSALEREPQHRRAFLAHACVGDEALGKEVESLISAHEESGEFIEDAAADVAAELLASEHAGLKPGQMIASYRVISLLGEGGMGEVYLAEDLRLHRNVALKLLPPYSAVSTGRVRRFEQEARAASALNHPNIVTIHDVGRWQDRDFIATEFVDGQTLRELMHGTTMNVDQALDFAVQLASAVSAAHEAGIVHRDIKPENVMVRPDGIVKVLDFGLAKLASQQREDSNSIVTTNPGMVMGTVQYMSPEQACGDDVDARTDIWSMGVVLYEMFAGRAPFVGPTPSHVIVSVLENNPPPVAQYAEVPAELDEIITKALNKDRQKRYQTMKEMLGDLRELRDQQVFRSAPRLRRYSSRLGRQITTINLTVIMPLVIAAAIGAGIYTWWKSNPAAIAFANIGIKKVTVPQPVYAGSISPDGKYIAYISLSSEGQSLWVKQVNTDSSLQLVPAGQVVYWGLDFSPDSNFVYYVVGHNENREGVLYRVPILGGVPRKLVLHLTSVNVSPDGRRIAFKRGTGSPGSDEVQLLTSDLEGHDEHVVAQGVGPLFWNVDWSADSKSLVYINPVSHGETTEWYVAEIPATGGPEKRITQPSSRRLHGVVCMSNGEQLLLTADDEATGLTQVWLLSARDGEMRRLTHDLNQYLYISVTRDGGEILATMRSRPASLWVGSLENIDQARPVIPGPIDFDHIAWTPEGTVVSDEGPSLWESNADGSGRRLLIDNTTPAYPVVTADGRYIVFASGASGRLNIWRMDRDGSNLVQLTSDGGTLPSLSPDGQWIFYTNPFYEYQGVWRVPLSGGTAERVVQTLASKAAVSPDGKQLAYEHRPSNVTQSQIVVASLAADGPRKVFEDLSSGYGNLRWSPDGRALVFISNKSGDLELLPLAGGAAQKLVEHGTEELFSFDISSDGKRLAYTKGTLSSTLVLINDLK